MLDKEYDICVMMSTYNGEKYLEEQLNSIFNQTIGESIFVYVRDDGSVDSTINILEKYKKKTGRLEYLASENVGCFKSFNILLDTVPRAKYYAFSDQDDVWFDNKLEYAINMLEKHKSVPAVYCADYQITDDSLTPMNVPSISYRKGFDNNILMGANMIGCTVVFNSVLREEMNKFKPKPEYAMFFFHDALIMCFAELLDAIIEYDTRKVMYYRQHGANVSGTTGERSFFKRLREKGIISKIKNKRWASDFSRLALDIVPRDMYSEDKYKLMCSVVNMRCSLIDRIRVMFRCKLDYKFWYEPFVYNILLLLGWR